MRGMWRLAGAGPHSATGKYHQLGKRDHMQASRNCALRRYCQSRAPKACKTKPLHTLRIAHRSSHASSRHNRQITRRHKPDSMHKPRRTQLTVRNINTSIKNCPWQLQPQQLASADCTRIVLSGSSQQLLLRRQPRGCHSQTNPFPAHKPCATLTAGQHDWAAAPMRWSCAQVLECTAGLLVQAAGAGLQEATGKPSAARARGRSAGC